MGALEPGHLLILLVVLFVVVGPSRLPEVGKAAGEALREFRKATEELRDAAQPADQRALASASTHAGPPGDGESGGDA